MVKTENERGGGGGESHKSVVTIAGHRSTHTHTHTREVVMRRMMVTLCRRVVREVVATQSCKCDGGQRGKATAESKIETVFSPPKKPK